MSAARRAVWAAAALFVASALAYAATAAAGATRGTRAAVADVVWTAAALFAIGATWRAWRAAGAPDRRRGLAWILAGCVSWLVGQIGWDVADLLRGAPPGYPSLADAAFLAIYPCFVMAILTLLRAEPRRAMRAELVLDAGLVSYTAAALAFELLRAHLTAAPLPGPALVTSFLTAAGGIAVLWLLLVQMIYRLRFPLGSRGAMFAGVALLAATDIAHSALALHGAYAAGGALDLGWTAALLVIGVAAAVQPAEGATLPAAPVTLGAGAHLVALVVGVGGLVVLATGALLAPGTHPIIAGLLVAGGVLVLMRLGYAVRADRRYAERLEREVARQTRSLLESLDAAAVAERNLRQIMEAAPDAITILDRDGHVTQFNAAAREMVRAPAGTAPGRSVFEFLDPEARVVVEHHLDAAFHGEVRQFEVAFARDDGHHGVAAVIYAPVREPDSGLISRVIAVVRDVTASRRTQAQLAQAEKLAALGQLVSGVAHEINNPAAIISGFAQTLLREPLSPAQREMAEMVRDEATRIGRITSNLLAFARTGGAERTAVSLNDAVRRTHALRAYHAATLNVAVHLELAPDAPLVLANASEIQQLLLNLLINAEQALADAPGARAITLRTRGGGDTVRLEVEDTGPGVPPEIQRRIFDPFYTTKPEGVGTGLGLSICYGIVKEHGGRIWVESPPGGGAKFIVELPAAPAALARSAAAPAAPPAAPGPAGTPLRVLVVDDEPGIRNAATRFLRHVGISADAVGDGAAALAVLATETPDVVITDVRMPGMGGREFVERLRRTRPELVARLVFATGDAFAPETAALVREVGAPTLAKPFDFDELERVVRDVAARRPPGDSTLSKNATPP